MLTRALYLAQQAVELDSSESQSDMPAAVAAYGEAIALLQRVIAQRSQNPGRTSEVVRVTEIVSLFSYCLSLLYAVWNALADAQGGGGSVDFGCAAHFPLRFSFCLCYC